MPNFDATPPIVGYQYQKKCALKLLIDSIESTEVCLSLEKIDDIFIESPSKKISVQTKHSQLQNKSLTDRSSDFWKTIRIWSINVKNRIIDPNECFFVLITTAELAVSSILKDFSKQERNFDVCQKLKCITTIANEIPGRTGKKRCEDFLLLNEAEQISIIKNLHIYCNSDDIVIVSNRIKNKLKHSVDDKYIDNVYHRLYGWWEERIEKHLLDDTKQDVVRQEVMS